MHKLVLTRDIGCFNIESYPIGGWFLFGSYGALYLFNVLRLSYLNEVNLQKVAEVINHDKFVNGRK